MRHRTVLLVLVALACFSVGVLVGWRGRISTEEVKVYPRPMRPAVPDDLSWRDPWPEVVLGWRETGGRA